MKIIYIISTGRGGSTILDILLGNGENILSCGELNRYVVRRGTPTYWCHFEDSPTFLFWKKIKNKLTAKFSGEIDFDNLNKITRKYEYHAGFFNSGFNKKDFKFYSNYLLMFFETLFENIEDSAIVDSSKYPARALRLAKILPYEIDFIYIKRDPRGVVKSFAKKGIPQADRNWLSANMYYFLVNILCQLAVYRLKKRHKVIEIKYETLMKKPIETLTLIQNELQINLEPVIEKVKVDDFLTIGPLFEGNRMRMTNKVKLETKSPVYPKTIKNWLTRLINLILYQ